MTKIADRERQTVGQVVRHANVVIGGLIKVAPVKNYFVFFLFLLKDAGNG